MLMDGWKDFGWHFNGHQRRSSSTTLLYLTLLVGLGGGGKELDFGYVS